MSKESQATGFFLARRIVGCPIRLPITEERFEQLRIAWRNLGHLANIEEEWDAVVQNYVELEKSLLETALQDMLISDKDYFSFQAARLQFAVRLSNLLSSCKAYIDHTPHHLQQMTPSQSFVDDFKALASAEYDNRFGYRFMEALRTHAQHRGLPIHGAQYHSAWVEGGDANEGMLQFSVSTQVDLNLLRRDKKFKRSLLKDLTGERLEAEPYVRDYLEGLSAVHVATQKLTEDAFKDAKELVQTALADFEKANSGGSSIGLNAAEIQERNKWVQRVPLFDELIQLIVRLRRRNRPMVNLRRRFVTSGIKAARPKKR